jgi:hypothetical protein
MKIVGVMASGKKSLVSEHNSLAKQVGSTVAELGYHLLTGGGGGLMKAVGQAVLRAKKLPHLRKDGNTYQIPCWSILVQNIFLFATMNCPFCQTNHSTLNAVVQRKSRPTEIGRLVFRLISLFLALLFQICSNRFSSRRRRDYFR